MIKQLSILIYWLIIIFILLCCFLQLEGLLKTNLYVGYYIIPLSILTYALIVRKKTIKFINKYLKSLK